MSSALNKRFHISANSDCEKMFPIYTLKPRGTPLTTIFSSSLGAPLNFTLGFLFFRRTDWKASTPKLQFLFDLEPVIKLYSQPQRILKYVCKSRPRSFICTLTRIHYTLTQERRSDDIFKNFRYFFLSIGIIMLSLQTLKSSFEIYF